MERPDFGPEPHISEMTCCCGRIDCALLKKNCSILETVEKDVHTAAQLGQVSQVPIFNFGAFLCFYMAAVTSSTA
jgi:hypothetical protein